MASGYPVRISPDAKASLKRLFSKLITRNQLLVLSKISGSEYSLSSFLRQLSDSYNIPLSTLKLSMKRLRQFDLVRLVYDQGSDSYAIDITAAGLAVLQLALEERLIE